MTLAPARPLCSRRHARSRRCRNRVGNRNGPSNLLCGMARNLVCLVPPNGRKNTRTNLRQKAVAYLNSDDTAKGWLHVSGSHTLEDFMAGVAGSVTQPGANTNLADAALNRPPSDDSEEPPPANNGSTFTDLRSGRRFGLRCLSRLSGHRKHERRLRRPNQERHLPFRVRFHLLVHTLLRRQLCRWQGAIAVYRYCAFTVRRSSILPFEFGHFATTVRGYLDDIQKEVQKSGRNWISPRSTSSSTR